MMDIQYPDHLEQLTVRLDPRAQRILAGTHSNIQSPGKGRLLAAACGGMILGIALVIGYQQFTLGAPLMAAANEITRAEISPEPVAIVQETSAAGIDTVRQRYLQVATFGQEQRALDLQQQLEKHGIADVIVVANLERTPLYRVRVGPLQGPDRQAEIRAQLGNAGFADTLLVQSSVPALAIGVGTPDVADTPEPAPADGRRVASAAAPVADARTTRVKINRPWGTRSAATQLVLRAGISAMRAGDAVTAENKFRQVLMVEPDATQASTYLYTLLMNQQRIDEADSVAVAGLDKGSDVIALAKLYAQSLLSRGDSAAALQVLADHRETAFGDPEYSALLAAGLQGNKRHEEAARIYEHLLTLDQQMGDWWVGLGIAHDGSGRPAAALQAFQRARETSSISSALADYSDRRIAELQQ